MEEISSPKMFVKHSKKRAVNTDPDHVKKSTTGEAGTNWKSFSIANLLRNDSVSKTDYKTTRRRLMRKSFRRDNTVSKEVNGNALSTEKSRVSGSCKPQSRETAVASSKVMNLLIKPNINTSQYSPTIELCCKKLWRQFSELGTEMIVNRNGRRMFPVLKVQVSGLDPSKQYVIYLDFKLASKQKHRYLYQSSEWTAIGPSDCPISQPPYVHPLCPLPGSKQKNGFTLTFDHLKLTNNPDQTKKGMYIVHSMHRYAPRVYVQPLQHPSEPLLPQLDPNAAASFTFPEAEFMTVTAYQNHRVTKLKITNNPFAKGFRESSRESIRALTEPKPSTSTSLNKRKRDMNLDQLRHHPSTHRPSQLTWNSIAQPIAYTSTRHLPRIPPPSYSYMVPPDGHIVQPSHLFNSGYPSQFQFPISPLLLQSYVCNERTEPEGNYDGSIK